MNFYIKSLCRPRAGMAKILLVMKLIVILLTAAIVQVSASSYAQNVTLKQRNAKLTSILDQIRKQTGYDFFYSQAIMENAKTVDIDLNKVNIEKALEVCFKDQPLTYTIENKIVTIKEKEVSFLDKVFARFQEIDVRGRVVDEKGGPIQGANVKVKGTNHTASTDANGEFILKNVTQNALLTVTYIGFQTREVKATWSLNIILLTGVSELQETTIKGYYKTSKDLNTGSVSSLKAADIAKQPISDPLTSLEGRM